MVAESPVKRAIHPNSLANLQKGRATQIKPGQRLNPAGPPPGKVQLWQWVRKYSEMTARQLDKIAEDKSLPANRLMALSMVREMMAGDWQRIKEALDRDEGPIVKKVEQALTHTGQVSHLHELAPAEAEVRAMAMLDQTAAARQLQTGGVDLLPGLPAPGSAAPSATDPADANGGETGGLAPLPDAAAAGPPPPIDSTCTTTDAEPETDMGVGVERCVGEQGDSLPPQPEA